MDLTSRLRSIVKGASTQPRRELTYEPDIGGYEAGLDLRRVGEILGGLPVETPFGQCLTIDRRYEADRSHGDVRIGDCELTDLNGLAVLDPLLPVRLEPRRTIFIDLETTGLSGGAGMVAFLVGCGYFDLGAFQVRQFLLTSYSAERALLSAAAEFFDGTDLIVTYNGKTFDVPVMETRWLFHRMEMPLEGIPHFDMLHPARRLWRGRAEDSFEEGGCRLSTLERLLFDVVRIGDVSGFEVPGRFFRFLRSGDPRLLEPVLEHNRLDLVSLAAVTARAARLVVGGNDGWSDGAEAVAVGRVLERAGQTQRAEACYRWAAECASGEVRAEALYHLGLRCRRDRRFPEAAAAWRLLLEAPEPRRGVRAHDTIVALRRFAAEALAIHHEHRTRDLPGARELATLALEQSDERRAVDVRHRLARIDRKMQREADRRALLD